MECWAIRQPGKRCGGRRRRLPQGDIRVGVVSAMATAQPAGRAVMRSPRWDGQKSTGAVRSAPRGSSMPKAGMQTETSQSHCARASGSPWGCALPSSLPLCGSVMTFSCWPGMRIAVMIFHLDRCRTTAQSGWGICASHGNKAGGYSAAARLGTHPWCPSSPLLSCPPLVTAGPSGPLGL